MAPRNPLPIFELSLTWTTPGVTVSYRAIAEDLPFLRAAIAELLERLEKEMTSVEILDDPEA
jgi:hypothetical protein